MREIWDASDDLLAIAFVMSVIGLLLFVSAPLIVWSLM